MSKRKHMSSGIDRRGFLKVGAVGAGAAGLIGFQGCASSDHASNVTATALNFDAPDLGPAPANPFSSAPLENVRIGYVGVGGMGTAHVRNLIKIEGCQITAICDINEAHAQRAADLVVEAGRAFDDVRDHAGRARRRRDIGELEGPDEAG